ncbi:interleukin-1 receptor type 1 [Polymixia lowei]
MTATGCRFLLVVVLSFAPGHSHRRAQETYDVSDGHFFFLRCGSDLGRTNVTWSRGGNHTMSLPSGVEVREGDLWFLPMKASHNGTYTCERRYKIHLNDDCSPVERHGESVSINQQGDMRLLPASQSDAGVYTCQVELSLDGRRYTAARSIRLKIDNGSGVELKCLAVLGFSVDDEDLMYWTVNGSHTDDNMRKDPDKYHFDGRRVHGESVLSIPEVLPEFLDVPICCHVVNPTGQDTGCLWLQGADHSVLYVCLALGLVFSLVLLAVAAAFLFFKVELVLAYRKLRSFVAKEQVSDGKLYDAYVSYLHGADATSSETAAFALEVLPEVLERCYGYTLYIRGRDDSPGEAIHDVIAEAVHRSRRLIIILSTHNNSSIDPKMEELLPRQQIQNQLGYEQKIGLYDALTQNGPRVILVEIDGPVGYSSLPESLRYIRKTQGSLKWRRASPGNHKLFKTSPNRLFWKYLRYHMPSVPGQRRLTIV